jgi:hypothetical protein
MVMGTNTAIFSILASLDNVLDEFLRAKCTIVGHIGIYTDATMEAHAFEREFGLECLSGCKGYLWLYEDITGGLVNKDGATAVHSFG